MPIYLLEDQGDNIMTTDGRTAGSELKAYTKTTSLNGVPTEGIDVVSSSDSTTLQLRAGGSTGDSSNIRWGIDSSIYVNGVQFKFGTINGSASTEEVNGITVWTNSPSGTFTNYRQITLPKVVNSIELYIQYTVTTGSESANLDYELNLGNTELLSQTLTLGTADVCGKDTTLDITDYVMNNLPQQYSS